MDTIYKNASLACGTDKSIRLLELLPSAQSLDGESFEVNCKFHVAPVAKFPYTAISYMWGEDTETRNILIDGKKFLVRVNLYQLLELLSREIIGYLWVDAICINQTSLKERNHQVGLMGMIYSRARDVTVWLGSNQWEISEAMKLLQSPYARLDVILLGNPQVRAMTSSPGIEEAEDVFWTFCTHPYWTRAWIIQELVLAKDVLIRCGNDEIRIETFAVQLEYLREGLKRMFIPQMVTKILNSPAAKLIAKRKTWQESNGRSYINPWDTGLGILGCSDVRDRVYAMIALMDPSQAVAPDYNNSPSELFKDIFERHLARNGVFFGAIWNLQPMLELDDEEPIIQQAKVYGSLEYNAFWRSGRQRT